MSAPVAVERAQLRQLDASFKNEIEPTRWVTVQFNPESLKVSFANQLQTGEGGGNKSGAPSPQFVGKGTTKLAVSLWFDVSSDEVRLDGAVVEDVRKLTEKVAYFITPGDGPGSKPDKKIPPIVRFLWGSFQFDGIVESMEESIELFSPEGRPLRASVALAISRADISKYAFGGNAQPIQPDGSPATGTQPLTPAPQGGSVQQMATSQGKSADWQRIAEANNVDNPRQVPAGTLLDMNPPRRS